MKKMANEDYNFETEEANERIKNSSKFLKMIYDFAKYMEGDMDQEQHAMMIVAGDRKSNNGKTTNSFVLLGAGSLLITNLAMAMRNEPTAGIFREARALAGIKEDRTEDSEEGLRKRLRRYYWASVPCAIYTIVLTILAFTKIISPFSAVCSLLCMAVTFLILYNAITPLRSRIQHIQQQKMEEAEERIKALSHMLSLMMQQRREEEEDD